MSSSRKTWLLDLPDLSKSDLIYLGGSLVNLDVSDSWDLSIVELWDMNIMLLSWCDLLDHGVSQQRDVDEVLSGDPVLRNINVVNHRKVDRVFNGSSIKSGCWGLSW